MAITYDPNNPTKPLDPTAIAPPVQPKDGIFNTAMQTTVAPAQPSTEPQPTGIVGAQSTQLDKPMGWNVTDDQTVEGRINRIIKAGSPLMEQAKSRSLEAANARGLSNTSMAVTAGESALYDAALPIAQSDAATFAKAAGYNADQTNQFKVQNANFENEFKLQDKGNQQQKDMALIQRETQVQLANLDAQNKAQAEALAQANQRLLETNSQAASAFQTAMSAINNIQNNNQMDANTKTQAIAQVWRDVQTQLRVMGAVSGLNLTSQLNFANYPGFDANGNFVGFDSSGNTAGGVPSPGAVPASSSPTATGPTGSSFLDNVIRQAAANAGVAST